MDVFGWINKKVAYAITGGIIIGLIASANKGLQAKDTPRAFMVRLFGGATMAGLVSFLLSDIDMPKLFYGLILWFVGWSSGEVGAVLAQAGKDKLEDVTGTDKNDNDGTKSDAVG